MIPSVCVALAVKNGEAYIAEAIESVLAQSGVTFELRVIDNQSDDATVEIASRYLVDPRVTVDVNDEDYLYYGSLNRALAATQAEYFVPFANDDRMLERNLVEKVRALEASDAALAHSTALWMDENGVVSQPVIDHRMTPPWAAAPSFFTQLVPYNRVVCPSAVVRVSALRSLGGFDARDDYAADWLAWLRLSLRFSVVTLAEPLVAYRAHPDAESSRMRRLGLIGYYEPATLGHVLDDDAFPPEWRGWRDRLMAASYAKVAEELDRHGARRLEQGFGAYMIQGRALARQPQDREMQDRYHSLVTRAGLSAPSLPMEGVTVAPATGAQRDAMATTVAEIGPLLKRLLIHVDPELLEPALALLEPVFAASPVDAVVIPDGDPQRSLSAGRIVIAPWQSALIGLAESAGLPAWPTAIPDPFVRPAEAAKWETLTGA
jgi:glycosyltransferase involved in cell wall biosynthesis